MYFLRERLFLKKFSSLFFEGGVFEIYFLREEFEKIFWNVFFDEAIFENYFEMYFLREQILFLKKTFRGGNFKNTMRNA